MIQINTKWVATNLFFAYLFFIAFTLYCILQYSTILAIKTILNDYIIVMAIGLLFSNLWYFKSLFYSFIVHQVID
ncbi:MAG: hypothetical protein COB38_03680 [Gammaproteobacteria bacterium]|nr:MAG: hypothetical protein COB38_03680 [Gammaproteobacteria bacterium]